MVIIHTSTASQVSCWCRGTSMDCLQWCWQTLVQINFFFFFFCVTRSKSVTKVLFYFRGTASQLLTLWWTKLPQTKSGGHSKCLWHSKPSGMDWAAWLKPGGPVRPWAGLTKMSILKTCNAFFITRTKMKSQNWLRLTAFITLSQAER